jgi:hypothetical protein
MDTGEGVFQRNRLVVIWAIMEGRRLEIGYPYRLVMRIVGCNVFLEILSNITEVTYHQFCLSRIGLFSKTRRTPFFLIIHRLVEELSSGSCMI